MSLRQQGRVAGCTGPHHSERAVQHSSTHMYAAAPTGSPHCSLLGMPHCSLLGMPLHAPLPVPQEAFERKDLGDDCRARATALHMHLYNTTALKARPERVQLALALWLNCHGARGSAASARLSGMRVCVACSCQRLQGGCSVIKLQTVLICTCRCTGAIQRCA